MKKMCSVLCLAVIFVLITTVIYYQDIYPLKTNTLIAEKYSGWSGVLRVWIYEGWQPGAGSLSGWLNTCSTAFEKNHEGVYIQIQYVDASAIVSLNENGVIPPDMIIFPPGLLETPRYLIPLENDESLRPAFINTGVYSGVPYAQPIAMGGYIWAYNTDLLEEIPDTWADVSVTIAAPVNDRHHMWDASLMGLCSGRFFSEEESDISELQMPGLDLGLSITDETPVPTATATPSSSQYSYCILPDEFFFSETAYSDFIEGKVAAIPVTQREVYRLEQRSAQGKGPDWKLGSAGEISFSDQVLFAAVVDRPDNLEKQNLCKSFIKFILTEECQKQIFKAKAFSVTKYESGYSRYEILADMEYMLRNNHLYISSAFKSKEDEYISSIVRDFIQKQGFSSDILNRITPFIN